MRTTTIVVAHAVAIARAATAVSARAVMAAPAVLVVTVASAALAVAAASAAAAAAAPPPSWSVAGLPAEHDAGGARAARSAAVDGAWLAFFRGPEGVWIYVRAPAGEVLGERGPLLRIDGGAAFDLRALTDDYERLGIDWGRRTSRDLALPLGAAAGVPAPLADVLAGREIDVTFAGGRVVRIPLDGAAVALRDALHLDASGRLADATPDAQAESLHAYTVTLNRSCIALGGANLGACLARIAGCSQTSIDAADLLACAAARGMELPRAWQPRTVAR